MANRAGQADLQDTIAGTCGVLLAAIGVSGIHDVIYDSSAQTGNWIFSVGFAIFGGMITGAAIAHSGHRRKDARTSAKKR